MRKLLTVEMRGLRSISLAVVFFGLMVGCARDKKLDVVPVSGKVTMGGQPLPSGIITFENRDAGFASSAPIGADGSYILTSQYGPGAPVGNYVVTVAPPSQGQPRPGVTAEPVKHKIPQKYHVAETSPLRAEVLEGDPIDFTLDP